MADWDTVRSRLADPDAATRRWAARDAAMMPEASAALAARLREEGEPSVRKVILTSLTRIGDRNAITSLVQCLRCEDDARLRGDAIEAFKALPGAVSEIVTELLGDADSDVRIQAISMLEVVQDPRVEAWLIEIIEHDPVLNVCAAALNLLTEIGTCAASAALTRLQARYPEEPYIRFATDLAFRRIAGG
jgi:HEAT repeat protein